MNDDYEPPRDATPEPFTVVDGEKSDSAPRRQRKRPTPPPNGGKGKPTTGVPYQPGVIATGLSNLYGQVGMFLGMFDPVCGKALMENAQAMAASLEKAAKDNHALNAFLRRLVSTSVIGEVIAAHAPFAMAVVAHHTPALRAKMETMNLGDTIPQEWPTNP